jgi:hypothetical protein
VAEIVERTDGVPLFIEELTKAVLEAGPQAPAALSARGHHTICTKLHAKPPGPGTRRERRVEV